MELLVVQGAVPEVQVDQALIGHAELRGKRLEVGNSGFVQSHCDGLFELLDVRVLLTLHLVEVVMFSHNLIQ
ncbi:MAG: hypothetical protein MAG581_00531 [Deltaproteobacteria bacterium]|nr:hypothetical protein [Deltaproteobacteria bacterium]